MSRCPKFPCKTQPTHEKSNKERKKTKCKKPNDYKNTEVRPYVITEWNEMAWLIGVHPSAF